MKNRIGKEVKLSDNVIYRTGNHWVIFVREICWIPMTIISWWFLLLFVFTFSYRLYHFFSYELLLTDKKLIEKKGFYYIRTNEWPLNKIGDVVYTQFLGGQLWNRGKIILTGHQITGKKFINIWNAKKLRDAIHSQLPAK